MPRLVPISHSETLALLALRRTLWQLAFVGIVAAAILVRVAPDSRALAAWCILVPLNALAVHFRHVLRRLLPTRRRSAGIYWPHENRPAHTADRRPAHARRLRQQGRPGPARQIRVAGCS